MMLSTWYIFFLLLLKCFISLLLLQLSWPNLRTNCPPPVKNFAHPLCSAVDVDKRTQRWGHSFMWTFQEVKEEETKCLKFDLLLPGLNLRVAWYYSFFFFYSPLLLPCPFEDRCFGRPAGGLMLLFVLMGQENEHFLRFNPPHNCWKETKLSAVNSAAPLCRAGPPRVLVRRALSHGRPPPNTLTPSRRRGLTRPNSFIFFLFFCVCLLGGKICATDGTKGTRRWEGSVMWWSRCEGLTRCPWW